VSGNGAPAKWDIKDGWIQCKPGAGDIHTKDQFGDCQLHIEWAAPKEVKGDSQGRGNSGIFLFGVEIQVLDSYNNITYADGHAASVYSVMPPMANALRPPGEFQVYDIVFRRPIYKGKEVVDPGYVTVFVNGVLAQDHTMLEGRTGHMGRAKPGSLGDKTGLNLQDHGNTTRFRNIWYRELPPRATEGGTDGYLSTEATMAKRKAIGADIRADAEKLTDAKQLLRYMESLSYDNDQANVQKVEELTGKYLASVKALQGAQLAAKKDEVKRISDAYKYLARFKEVPADFGPKSQIEALIKEQGWDKKAPAASAGH
jgi:prepilin-type processing-associated H-X9-DG protein